MAIGAPDAEPATGRQSAIMRAGFCSMLIFVLPAGFSAQGDDLPTKDSSDAAQVTSQSDKVLSQPNFRDDVNVDGVMISATN